MHDIGYFYLNKHILHIMVFQSKKPGDVTWTNTLVGPAGGTYYQCALCGKSTLHENLNLVECTKENRKSWKRILKKN